MFLLEYSVCVLFFDDSRWNPFRGLERSESKVATDKQSLHKGSPLVRSQYLMESLFSVQICVIYLTPPLLINFRKVREPL